MNRRLLLWLARIREREPRALAQLDRLQLCAAGLAGCAAGGALSLILGPAIAALLAATGNGWQ